MNPGLSLALTAFRFVLAVALRFGGVSTAVHGGTGVGGEHGGAHLQACLIVD